MNTTITLTPAQIKTLRAVMAIVDSLDQPATQTRKPATRKAPKKAAAPKSTKGAQTRETLSRHDWNRTLTTLAKTRTGKDSGAYKALLADWTTVQDMRGAGYTPVETLKEFGFTVRTGR